MKTTNGSSIFAVNLPLTTDTFYTPCLCSLPTINSRTPPFRLSFALCRNSTHAQRRAANAICLQRSSRDRGLARIVPRATAASAATLAISPASIPSASSPADVLV